MFVSKNIYYNIIEKSGQLKKINQPFGIAFSSCHPELNENFKTGNAFIA